jgi:hypothetical protein
MDFSYRELVEQYIANRRKKAELKKQFEAEVAKIDAYQQLIESYFLLESDRTELKNFPTPTGTAYRYRQNRVAQTDKKEFSEFVHEHKQWGLIIMQPAKNECVSWMEATGFAPPGLKIERIERFGFLKPGQTAKDDDE